MSMSKKQKSAMKSMKVGVVKYRSRSAYAKTLLLNTNLSDADIARKTGITSATVNAVKMRMALVG